MRKSPHQLNHKRRKTVRSIKKDDYVPDEQEMKAKDFENERFIDSLTGNKKKRYQHKKAQLESMKNGMREKKAKLDSKRAKFQNHDEVDYETEPDSIHVEGEKWIQVIKSQVLNQSKRLKNKMERYFGKK